MKKLHLFLVRSFIRPFSTTFFVVLFILLMLFLFKYIDDLIGKSFPWYTIMELIFYANLTNVTLALPLAILLSSIMTFGDLGEKYELVAIKSAGISLQRAMYPLILLMCLMTGLAFYFTNVIGPMATLKMDAILYDVQTLKPNFLIKTGIFNNDLGSFTIRADYKKKDTLKQLMIYDHSSGGGNTNVMIASSGIMTKSDDDKFLLFRLKEGVRYSEEASRNNFNPRQQFTRFKFGRSERKFPLEGFKLNRTNESLFSHNYMMMNSKQLLLGEDSIRRIIRGNAGQLELNLKSSFTYFNLARKMDTLKRHPPKNLQQNILENSKTFIQKTSVMNSAIASMRASRAYLPGNVQTVKTQVEELRKYQVEFQRKFSMSFACLVLFFIGAPLGAIIRKGGIGMPMVISILFFLIFQILTSTGEKFGKNGVLPVFGGVWLATFILVPIGLFLTYKASTDSQIFDIQSYLSFFSRFRLWKKAE